jgi:hypothetical protein
VRNADSQYNSTGFKAIMDHNIENKWKTIYDTVLPKYASQSINTTKKKYDLIPREQGLKLTGISSLGKSAQKLGVDTLDATGNALPAHTS